VCLGSSVHSRDGLVEKGGKCEEKIASHEHFKRGKKRRKCVVTKGKVERAGMRCWRERGGGSPRRGGGEREKGGVFYWGEREGPIDHASMLL